MAETTDPTPIAADPIAADPDPTPPKAAPKMGSPVIVRRNGQSFPGIVVDVRDDGTVDVQVFQADHGQHAAHKLAEVTDDTSDGWHWPEK